MLRVVLICDEPVVTAGCLAILAGNREIEYVCISSGEANLFERLRDIQPEMVLLDLNSPAYFGLIGEFRTLLPACKIVLWVRTISTELARQAITLGVRGILRKTLPEEMLLKCLRKVSEGDLWFEKPLTASFFQTRTVSLTAREARLVRLLSCGLKNKEIATELHLSEGTVKVYLSRLFAKVGATQLDAHWKCPAVKASDWLQSCQFRCLPVVASIPD